MLYDNVYIEKIGSQDDDTATVIVATTDAGDIESVLAAWTLMHEA